MSTVETRERRRVGTARAGAIVTASGGAVALIPVPPWTQIAGAAIAAVGAGIGLAAQLRERGSKALMGDKSAVAVFARRAARWSQARRKRTAEKLLKDLRKLRAKKRQGVPRQTHEAVLELKLGVLYGLEHEARKDPKKPLVADQPETAPVVLDAQPESAPIWPWLAAGAVVVVGAGVLRRSKKESR